MGCSTCAKIFLVIVNFLFVAIGIAFLVVGCLLRFGKVDFLNEQIMSLLEGVGAADGADISFGSLVGTAALGLIISGVIIFIIGCLGMFGACCTVKWMLIMYAVIIGVIILAEVVGVILLFTLSPQVEAFVKTFLSDTLKSSYAGSTSTDAASLAWNYVFTELNCCGITTYTDTHLATRWSRQVTDPSTSTNVTLITPLACCKLNGTFPNFVLPSSYACAVTPTALTSNYQTACYNVLRDLILSLSGYFIGIGVGILLLELLVMISAIVVYKSADPKVHPVQHGVRPY